eukprot:5048088-Prymnesium_polylepis.1
MDSAPSGQAEQFPLTSVRKSFLSASGIEPRIFAFQVDRLTAFRVAIFISVGCTQDHFKLTQVLFYYVLVSIKEDEAVIIAHRVACLDF